MSIKLSVGYNEMEEILDTLEDVALGYLAKERESHSKPTDYLNIEKVEEKIEVMSNEKRNFKKRIR